MAERRMFAKTIVDSDAFLEMPQSTQLFYFHLSMKADDDGFVNKPKSIMREIGCKDDDLKILCAKKFIIPFASGIVVIKHWKIHNYIQNDRKHDTKYKDELRSLELDENKAYRISGKKYIEIKDDTSKIIEECIIDGEIIDPDCSELRKEAYTKSDLPYSFLYKIRQAFWNTPCPICGVPMNEKEYTKNMIPSIQHNIPITKGGKHELGNISVICKKCNVSIRNNVTGKLNSEKVAKVWHEMNVSILDTQVRLGKVRIGKDSNTLSGKPDEIPYKSIIDNFNEQLGTSYKATSQETRRLIHARWEAGFKEKDFADVVMIKKLQWSKDLKMRIYLRPNTLFGTKFESYLQESSIKKTDDMTPFERRELERMKREEGKEVV